MIWAIPIELSPGGKGCGLLFKRTDVRLPYYREKPVENLLSMTVSARAHAHYPPRRKERELVRLRRFSFLRDLIVFWLLLTPLAWLVAAGVIAALRSKSSTLRRGALREEPGLTAVAFSLSIRSHLHLGFAFRPREHLLAQAVHQVAPAGRAARIQRVFLVLPRGRPPESSSNARYSKYPHFHHCYHSPQVPHTG